PVLARHRSARALPLRQEAQGERPAVPGGRGPCAALPRPVLANRGGDGRGQPGAGAGAWRAGRVAARALHPRHPRPGAPPRGPRPVRCAIPRRRGRGRAGAVRGRGRRVRRQEPDVAGRHAGGGEDRRVRPQADLVTSLLDSRTRSAGFVGGAVALVIAETPAAARDGAERVVVDYEPLPAVTATGDAVATGAPLVWKETASNVCVDSEAGDRAATDAAFGRAAHV